MEHRPASSNQTENKLAAARTRLILDKPFLGALVLRLPMVAADPKWCPTTATDARRFYFNADYIASLSMDETQFMLAHEALHCALSHFARRQHRTKSRWDRACDYAINPLLLEEGLSPPANSLMNGGFKGMTYTLPAFVEGSTTIFGISVDYQRLLVVVIGAVLVAALWLFTRHTRVGLALRGMAQDERAALMLGIDSDLMAVVAMGIGSMLAAFAAILLLPLGNIVVESGYNVLILAIAVCIVGGIGSWMGAVLAAFLIGYAQILTVVFLGSHYQMMVALLAIILTLILKPSGLFGQQKELEERV